MTYVVLGATGLLGRHISRQLASRCLPRVLFGHSAASADGRVSRIDIRDPHAVDAAIRRAAPRAVVNAANDKSDWHTTAVGPANLARACERHGVRLVHVSSDAVFSGREPSYDENSAPEPATPYGAAKAAAETAVAMFANTVIVRTSWLIGDGMPPVGRAGTEVSPLADGTVSSFERLVRELAAGATGRALYVDDIATPLHAADLASAILEIADHELTGLINVAGRELMSRSELGTAYAKWAGIDTGSLRQDRRYGDDGPVTVRLDSSTAGRMLSTRIRPIEEVYGAGDA